MTTKTLEKKVEECPLIEKCKSYYEHDRKICYGENKNNNYTECVAYQLNVQVAKLK